MIGKNAVSSRQNRWGPVRKKIQKNPKALLEMLLLGDAYSRKCLASNKMRLSGFKPALGFAFGLS